MTPERIRRKRTRGEAKVTSVNAPVRSIAPQPLLQKLQRNAGNRMMQVLSGAGVLQRKLTIGAPNDIYEREADQVADAVMRMPAADLQRAPDLERAGSPCGDSDQVQLKSVAGDGRPRIQREMEEEEVL